MRQATRQLSIEYKTNANAQLESAKSNKYRDSSMRSLSSWFERIIEDSKTVDDSYSDSRVKLNDMLWA